MFEEEEVNYFSKNNSPFEKKVTQFLKILMYIGIGACFCMVFITVRHTLGRYAFNDPLRGNAELNGVFLLILVFMVIAFTQMRRGHIEMGILVDRFSTRIREIIACIINILVLIFLFWATWYTGLQATKQIVVGNVFKITYIPYYPFLFLISFCWATFILTVSIQLYHSIRKVIRGVDD